MRRGSHLFLPSNWTSMKTLSWGVWQEKQARTSLSFSSQALMPSHNLFHKEEKKKKGGKGNTFQDEHAVCCGLEAGRWLKQRQGSGYPGEWPTLPLTSLPTRWDGCSPGTAPVAPAMASASCSSRIYRPLSYQTWWISSPTPFPPLALHGEMQRVMQHWGLTCLEWADHHDNSSFQDSGFLANTYSFLSSPSQEKSNFRKSCQSRVQERKL